MDISRMSPGNVVSRLDAAEEMGAEGVELGKLGELEWALAVGRSRGRLNMVLKRSRDFRHEKVNKDLRIRKHPGLQRDGPQAMTCGPERQSIIMIQALVLVLPTKTPLTSERFRGPLGAPRGLGASNKRERSSPSDDPHGKDTSEGLDQNVDGEKSRRTNKPSRDGP